MPSAIEIAQSQILDPGGLDEAKLEQTLGELMGRALDDADLYFQAVRSESWMLEDGIVKDGSHSN